MLIVLEPGKYHILFIQTVTDSVCAVLHYMELLSDSGVILKVKEISNLKALPQLLFLRPWTVESILAILSRRVTITCA